ncbi:hypothetical protein GGP65_001098 [Salinibacter ruber]|uniref:hypothetical protein n=1 Tax=Salinibacter ruber TaxID=146919 RepID=UPI002167E1EA|nr:hypothetical protein [Salinibacter ruber]MCS3663491.1 hypothetical protein [Salinibacter ruber]
MKEMFKSYLSYVLSISECPIVVSSMGRSGSTMLTRSILESAHKYKIIKNIKRTILQKYKTRLPIKYKNKIVYKTHDYPPKYGGENVKYIYIYDDPIKVVSSMYKKKLDEGGDWLREHAVNMKTDPKVAGHFLTYDSFKLEKHFESWVNAENINVALVRLDGLWENKDEISAFLGFDISIPKKKERKSSIDIIPKEKKSNLDSIYGDLRDKVKGLKFKIKNV